jgi:hypothetical protein
MWKPVQRYVRFSLLALCFAVLGACGADSGGLMSEPSNPVQPATRPHFYYADAWDVRRTAYGTWGTYDEIPMGDVDEPDDGSRKRCPDVMPLGIVSKDWKLTLTGSQLPGPEDPEYLAHFTFTGHKYFIQYVGYAANGLPLADYRYHEAAQTPDRRWIAQPNGRITLMCNGTVSRAAGFRAWSGRYWPVAHEGRITQGPNYSPPGSGGCGGSGGGTDYDAQYSSASYDPYASQPTGGGCTPGGLGGSGGVEDGGVCGGSSDLHYEGICIDVWNEESQKWEEVWCGVAVICH